MRFEPVLIVTILTVVHVFVIGTEPPMCQTMDFQVLVFFYSVGKTASNNNNLPCDFQWRKWRELSF